MKKVIQSSLLLALLSTAQLAGATNTWPILETSAQSQCAWLVRDTSARIFENEAQWQSVFPGVQAQVFARAPDWNKQVVVALTLGARPTPGFTIELTGKQFALHQEILRLGFREHGPATGDLSQQILTQPCVFILTPRGKWRHAVLRNADSGAELATNVLAPLDKVLNKHGAHQKHR